MKAWWKGNSSTLCTEVLPQKLKDALHEKSDFSVQPLCPLCDCFFEQFLNHRDRGHRDCTEKKFDKDFRTKPVSSNIPLHAGAFLSHIETWTFG
jgi:hypothetical protein